MFITSSGCHKVTMSVSVCQNVTFQPGDANWAECSAGPVHAVCQDQVTPALTFCEGLKSEVSRSTFSWLQARGHVHLHNCKVINIGLIKTLNPQLVILSQDFWTIAWLHDVWTSVAKNSEKGFERSWQRYTGVLTRREGLLTRMQRIASGPVFVMWQVESWQ